VPTPKKLIIRNEAEEPEISEYEDPSGVPPHDHHTTQLKSKLQRLLQNVSPKQATKMPLIKGRKTKGMFSMNNIKDSHTVDK
jgi:hypothetical protein